MQNKLQIDAKCKSSNDLGANWFPWPIPFYLLLFSLFIAGSLSELQAGAHLAMKLACKRYGDAWQQGDRWGVVAACTTEFGNIWAQMPATMFQQMPRHEGGRVLDSAKYSDSGQVAVETMTGPITFILRRQGDGWKVHDIMRYNAEGRFQSTQQLLSVCLTVRQFANEIRLLATTGTTKLNRSSLTPGFQQDLQWLNRTIWQKLDSCWTSDSVVSLDHSEPELWEQPQQLILRLTFHPENQPRELVSAAALARPSQPMVPSLMIHTPPVHHGNHATLAFSSHTPQTSTNSTSTIRSVRATGATAAPTASRIATTPPQRLPIPATYPAPTANLQTPNPVQATFYLVHNSHTLTWQVNDCSVTSSQWQIPSIRRLLPAVPAIVAFQQFFSQPTNIDPVHFTMPGSLRQELVELARSAKALSEHASGSDGIAGCCYHPTQQLLEIQTHSKNLRFQFGTDAGKMKIAQAELGKEGKFQNIAHLLEMRRSVEQFQASIQKAGNPIKSLWDNLQKSMPTASPTEQQLEETEVIPNPSGILND